MQGTIKYDFAPFVQGSDWQRDLVFSQNGSVIDLTGYTAKMTIRDEPHYNGNALFTLTTTADSDGAVITCGSTGLNLHITSTPSALFTWSEGYYDLKLTTPSSDGATPYVPLYGKVSVMRNIST